MPRPSERWTLRARAESFGHAARGLRTLLDEPNARIHLAVTLAVVTLGALLRIGLQGWLWLLVAIVLVWSAEALNTALEHLADAVHPERNQDVGHAKDIAAGAVLLCACAAAVIGLLVLGPPLLRLVAA